MSSDKVTTSLEDMRLHAHAHLGVLAHLDAGMTTLTGRLLLTAGAIDHVGSVDAGTTQTDAPELERERGITIRSAVASFAVGAALRLESGARASRILRCTPRGRYATDRSRTSPLVCIRE